MRWNRWNRYVLAAAVVGAGGCGAMQDDVTVASSAVLGDRLPGTNAALFAEAKAAFDANEQITDGVGPIFNEHSCGNCHSNGATGGAGENIERRFGRFVNGIFDPLAQLGGTLRQLFTVANFNNPNLPASSRGLCQPGNPTLCCVPAEVDPPQATIRNVGRLTTPVFGAGRVETTRGATIQAIGAAQPASIRGRALLVPIILPNPGDPTEPLNGTRVGKFGWKAGIASLM